MPSNQLRGAYTATKGLESFFDTIQAIEDKKKQRAREQEKAMIQNLVMQDLKAGNAEYQADWSEDGGISVRIKPKKQEQESLSDQMARKFLGGQSQQGTMPISQGEREQQQGGLPPGMRMNIGPSGTSFSLQGGKQQLSPVLKKAKDQREEDIITTIQYNNVKRDDIEKASQAAQGITGGLYGRVQRNMLGQFKPNDKMLGEWQKVKNVLTDAQLLNTAKTKGAISDREMELFAKAAANDDLASLPAIKVVLDKLTRVMGAEEMAKINSYRHIYGEDPRYWREARSNRGKRQLEGNKGLLKKTKSGASYRRLD